MSRRKAASRGAPATSQMFDRTGSARWLTFVALAGTLAAIGLRVLAAVVAGPLWRDEAGSASTATVSTFAEFWQRQHFDSFPLFWQLLLRFWTTELWNGSDA